jgi:hypothetical protein
MKKALLAVAALTCMGTAALAGPNEGGTLIAALSEGTVYTSDISDYCGTATTPDCESAVTETGAEGAPSVINVLAAFNPGNRLAGIVFGITYDPTVILLAWGPCGDFELPNANWPESGEGTAITWSPARTEPLVPVYWFAAYSYGGAGAIHLGPHPTQGGQFGDDSVPSVLDDIAGFGTFGFGVAGNAPCPVAGPTDGACCFADGTCQVMEAQACAAAGGSYQGDGTVCDPNPCPPPPAEGACCIGTDCVVTTAEDCARQGGEYQGDDTECLPETCGVIPTIESSWGAVKNNYR